MNIDKIKSCFNKASETYDDYNDIQCHTGMRLIASLKDINPTNMIDLGCGTGVITEKLARTLTYDTFNAIDIAEKSLTIANDRLLPFGIKTHLFDFDSIHLFDIKFDLVFANMALQWSPDLENTLRHIASQLTPDGILAFSIPLTHTFQELKNHFSVNEFNDAECIKKLLLKLNFSLEYSYSENKCVQFDSTLNALKSIKHVGAHATAKSSATSLRGRSSLPSNITSLTYHIGYFIARKNKEITS